MGDCEHLLVKAAGHKVCQRCGGIDPPRMTDTDRLAALILEAAPSYDYEPETIAARLVAAGVGFRDEAIAAIEAEARIEGRAQGVDYERARIAEAVWELDNAVLTLEFGEQIAYPRLVDRAAVLALLLGETIPPEGMSLRYLEAAVGRVEQYIVTAERARIAESDHA